jgi:hypothetical protein
MSIFFLGLKDGLGVKFPIKGCHPHNNKGVARQKSPALVNNTTLFFVSFLLAATIYQHHLGQCVYPQF